MRHTLARLNGVCNLNGFRWLPTGPLCISLAHETDHHLVVIDHYASVNKDRSADIFLWSGNMLIYYELLFRLV